MRSWLSKLWRDDLGQDFIEYALLCAALIVVVVGVLPPSLMPSVSTIFSKITSSFAIS
jgi:Flp pilus assembly pilin Flp